MFTIQLILLIILIDSLRHFYKILEEIWSCQCLMSSFDKDVIDVVIKELKIHPEGIVETKNQFSRQGRIISMRKIGLSNIWKCVELNYLVICALAIPTLTESWKSCGCSTSFTRRSTFWPTPRKIQTSTRYF